MSSPPGYDPGTDTGCTGPLFWGFVLGCLSCLSVARRVHSLVASRGESSKIASQQTLGHSISAKIPEAKISAQGAVPHLFTRSRTAGSRTGSEATTWAFCHISLIAYDTDMQGRSVKTAVTKNPRRTHRSCLSKSLQTEA